MSYCVHCGVELDKCADKCALCNTPVIDPNGSYAAEKHDTPFAAENHIPNNIQRRFIAYIITMCLLIPDIILFLVNVCFYRQQHWSLYVLATTFLGWVLFVCPFYTKKLNPYMMWGLDTVAVGAYTYFLLLLGKETRGIMLSFFAVITLISVSSLVLIIWLRKKKRHWTGIAVHTMCDSLFVSFIAGYFVSVFTGKSNFFYIGLICSTCFLALAAFFVYCNKSKRVREWLKKAFNL